MPYSRWRSSLGRAFCDRVGHLSSHRDASSRIPDVPVVSSTSQRPFLSVRPASRPPRLSPPSHREVRTTSFSPRRLSSLRAFSHCRARSYETMCTTGIGEPIPRRLRPLPSIVCTLHAPNPQSSHDGASHVERSGLPPPFPRSTSVRPPSPSP